MMANETDMNIRDLKYIVCVAECGHFGKAAEKCFVSQPTLSGQIKKLEESLGVCLFERTNRSVTITPEGEEIVKHARIILEQEEMIKALAQGYQDPNVGSIKLGVIPTLSPYLLPLLFAPLSDQMPDLHLVLCEEFTEILLQRLLNHELDAALIATNAEQEGLKSVPLFQEPFFVAMPSGDAMVEKATVTQKDLSETELLLLSEGHCLADQAMDICQQKRQTHGVFADLRASSLETLLQMVSAGFGSTLIPALALKSPWLNNKHVCIRELQFENVFREVSLVYRKSFPREQTIQSLSKIIRSVLPDSVSVL